MSIMDLRSLGVIASLRLLNLQNLMSQEKGPQNIEYPLLIYILCAFPFHPSINKNRAFLTR
jgi:hypothetical protein